MREAEDQSTTEIGDATACIITFDSLLKFAQEGWEYPLEDNPATRDAIYQWLRERDIPLLTLPTQEQVNELVGGKGVSDQSL